MATLEVHTKGRVEFVELARDHPVLFGTSASCDVHLDGEGIRPVHGRIAWMKRRFRVEASPDAQYVTVNGTKVTSKSIHQGDEITVGGCRIFLLRSDEDVARAGARARNAGGPTANPGGHPQSRGNRPRGPVDHTESPGGQIPVATDLEITKVIPPPIGPRVPPPSRPDQPAGHNPRPQPTAEQPPDRDQSPRPNTGQAPDRHQSPRPTAEQPPDRHQSPRPTAEQPPDEDQSRLRSSAPQMPAIESDEWASALKNESRGAEREPAVEGVLRGGRRAAKEVVAVQEQLVTPSRWRLLWDDIKRVGGPQAPGRERILSSPVVLGLFTSLVVLVAMGFGLAAIVAATTATRTFNEGVQDYDDGDYRTAFRELKSFVENNPKDSRRGKARVLMAMADVRQYVSVEGGAWTSALEASQRALEEVGGLEQFRDVRADLGDLMIKVGEGLADRARTNADPQALAEAASAVELHAKVAGEPALAIASLNRSRLPAKLSEARAAVRKAQVRSAALAAMDRALAERSANRVYEARDGLIVQYAGLAHDTELIARMTAANELIRRDVVIDATHRPAAREPRFDPLGPPTSLVWQSSVAATPVRPSPESTVFALADGIAYALAGNSGTPLWQVALGLSSSFVPRIVTGEPAVLAFDARHNDLVKLGATDGSLIWRLAMGEPLNDPPLVLGNQLFQVLPSGKLLVIALDSGSIQKTINLGRPLTRTPVHDESGQHLYVLGRQDCLFVLSREPLSCESVYYLGHLEGSIPCSPVALGRFLVIPENDGLVDSRWQILLVSEDGAKVAPAQQVKISGWTWSPPPTSGSTVWAIGDRGGYEAFSVGDYASVAPFGSMARLTADVSASGPVFGLARSDRDLWVASGHSGRFVLDAEHGKIAVKQPLPPPGPALAPVQSVGRLAVMTFQDQESSGIALWALDTDTGAIAWKTILGAPWSSPLAVAADSSELILLCRDGRDRRITTEQIARGGFLTQAIPRPGDFSVPAGTRIPLGSGGTSTSVISPHDKSKALWVRDPAKPDAWREVGLPTASAADPIAWGTSVLIPGIDSRAYLIDPLTGRSQADPYVPKFVRDRQGRWFSPTRLDKDTVVLADDIGRVIRLELKTAPIARLVGEFERMLDSHIIASPASTGSAVVVATADNRIRALAARDLSPIGSWSLDAPLASDPLGIGENCFVMDRTGGVMVFSRDGQRAWTTKLDSAVVGRPAVLDQSVAFLTRGGQLHVLGLSQGEKREHRELGIFPAGGVLVAGKQQLVPAGRGTIRPLAGQPMAGTQR